MGDEIFERMGELAGLVQRAADFGRGVLRENRDLKAEIRHFQRNHTNLTRPTNADVSVSERPGDSLGDSERVESLMEDNQDLAKHCVRLETENENLLNFYVASHELHSTLKVQQVLRSIQEIVINLIGAESFVIYLASKDPSLLTPALSEGMEDVEVIDLSLESDAIGQSLARGSIFVAESIDPSKEELIAGVPLAAEKLTLGAILIYKLLDQKDGFGELDHGLFALLAQHAGSALMAAQLYTTSEKTRQTFEAATRLILESVKTD